MQSSCLTDEKQYTEEWASQEEMLMTSVVKCRRTYIHGQYSAVRSTMDAREFPFVNSITQHNKPIKSKPPQPAQPSPQQ